MSDVRPWWVCQANPCTCPKPEPASDLDATRSLVRVLPRPTEAEENAAALDYAETALSECWAVLRRIAAGEGDPARVAADLLEAHGHEPGGAS